MVLDWLNFFISGLGFFISWLDGFSLIGTISFLDLIIVVAVVGLLINTFIAKGAR